MTDYLPRLPSEHIACAIDPFLSATRPAGSSEQRRPFGRGQGLRPNLSIVMTRRYSSVTYRAIEFGPFTRPQVV
eukprot:6206750-Pleurochrysis_carterae.AAC.2